MNFGDRLKKIRKDRKITQAELSRLSGLSQSAISALEKGVNEPSGVSIQQLSRALNIPPGDLLGEGQIDTAHTDLSAEEQQVIDQYRALTAEGRAYIRQQLRFAADYYPGKNTDLPDVENKKIGG